MVTESVVFLVLEWRLRRATGWREGALDHASTGVVAAPVVVFLTAALFFSTGGWDLLRLPGILTVLALPVALGAAFRAFRGDKQRLASADEDPAGAAGPSALWRWHPVVLALGLSLTGLVLLAVSTWASGLAVST